MSKPRKDYFIYVNGIKFDVKLNNRRGIHDIQPRIGYMLSFLAGRQWTNVKDMVPLFKWAHTEAIKR